MRQKKYGAPEMILTARSDQFSKVYHHFKPDYPTPNYRMYFYELCQFLEQNTNRLVYRHQDSSVKRWLTHVALTPEDVQRELGISRPTYFRFMSESSKGRFIRRGSFDGEHHGFFVNPAYAMNGTGMQAMLYLIFQDDPYLESLLSLADKECIAKTLGARFVQDEE